MIIDKDDVTLRTILDFSEMADKQVLEIGCGDGRITRGLAGKPQSLIAVDPDSVSLRAAEKKITGVDFHVGTGQSLVFADGTFDLVLFTLSLHHQDSSRALAEAARVLKNDGRILVVEPAVDSELAVICNLFRDETEVLNRAIEAMDESGFTIARRDVFYTSWEFNDMNELHDWLFDFYECPYDRGKVDSVNTLLEGQLQETPLLVEDKYMITSLTPG